MDVNDAAKCEGILINQMPKEHQSLINLPACGSQVKLLREAFKSALGEETAQLVDVNTIDGFQGREKDVCFFSCVR